MIIIRDRTKIILALAAIGLLFLIGVQLLTGHLSIRSQSPATDDARPVNAAGEEIGATGISGGNLGGHLSEYRLERDRVRSKEITLLREIAADEVSTARAKEEAYAKLVDLAVREEKEIQAEALIKAQGFADCAVIINPSAAMVMITGTATDSSGQERIRKSVSVATGFAEKSISILPVGAERQNPTAPASADN